jgi:signal transduction histidine kinase
MIRRRLFAKIVHSVFLKLLLVIIVAGICINLAVSAFFVHITRGYMQNIAFRKNWVQYVNYLVQDIGDPPGIERANALAQKLSITIGFESPDGTWQATGTLPLPESMELKKINENPMTYYGRHDGRIFLIVESGRRRYMFDLMRPYAQQRFVEEKIVFLIVLLSCILLFGYIAIRWLLKPVLWLNDGVQQVSSGNLDYRMPVKRHDEFGKLAAAFNSMTGRIKEMLHARERLLLDVSHELRSPITRMKVALEFIPGTEATRGMQADLRDMETMISDILETQRLASPYGQLNLEETDFEELVREVVEAYVDSTPAVLLENVQSGGTVILDRKRMKTVLKNVVDNALKYSDPSGPPVRIDLLRRSAQAILQVRDTGCGIPSRDLPHIFEPFYRVDTSRSKHTGGYGLGLSICKIIMEAHRGSITVESEPGQGTTVTMLLPEGSC